MPIYEYKCNECGEDSEILLRTSGAEAKCPHCQSADLTRLISVPGAVMTKGSSSSPEMPVCPNRERCGAAGCPGAQH